MNFRLIALCFAPFAFGTSAFVLLGLIAPVASDLSVTVAEIGYLQAAFALSCGIGGPFLARLTSHMNRKKLLVFVMFILAVLNTATAFATSFTFILFLRLGTGMFAALTLPLATTIAVTMVAEDKRASAISTVLVGYTIAFLLGIPLGSMLGDAFGWQTAFGFTAAISAVGLLTIALLAPPHVVAVNNSSINFSSALSGDNPRLMITSMLIFFATFSTVSFIGPVITATSNINGQGIGWVQIATGVGGIVGLPLGARLSKLGVRNALLCLLTITCITQVLFSIGMLFDLAMFTLLTLLLAMAIGSAALFASLPIIQAKLTQNAGAATTIAFALNGTMLYLGQGLGAFLAALVINTFGIEYLGILGALVAVIGMWNVFALSAER
ncbi:MFS transporter [Alteromonas sp. P256]|uniref:MFS transporter n=1 Tax=Alteromonas sp. P256 TaxID=3117399 RepID=UPI002FE21A73